jgi:transaldolase
MLNLFQAEKLGCPIITVPNDILKKAKQVGLDLSVLSLDTVKNFSVDAKAAGFKIL